MSLFEKLLNLKNLFKIRMPAKRVFHIDVNDLPKDEAIQHVQDIFNRNIFEAKIAENVHKKPENKSLEKVTEAESVDKRVRVSGYNVTYIVPKDMSTIIVRLLSPNGTFKAEYTLTQYLDIKPGERVQLIVKT